MNSEFRPEDYYIPSFEPHFNYKPNTPEWRVGFDYAKHPGQTKLFNSKKRFIHVCAASRSGKSICFGQWILNEFCRMGFGDVLAVAPTYNLLTGGVARSCELVFCTLLDIADISRVGKYIEHMKLNAKGVDMICKYREANNLPIDTVQQGRIIFRHTTDGAKGLRSWTPIAICADEIAQCSMNVEEEVYDEIFYSRPSVEKWGRKCRVLAASTPYYWTQWVDKVLHIQAEPDHPDNVDHEVINFTRYQRPGVDKAELDRFRDTWHPSKFKREVLGIPTETTGRAFYHFHFDKHVKEYWPIDKIPHDWPTYVSMDFGNVRFGAAIYVGHPERGVLYQVGEYYWNNHLNDEQRTTEEHLIEVCRRVSDIIGVPGYRWVSPVNDKIKLSRPIDIAFCGQKGGHDLFERRHVNEYGLNTSHGGAGEQKNLRVLKTNEMFAQDILFVHPSCTQTAKSLRSAVYKEGHNPLEHIDPDSCLLDLVDAANYGSHGCSKLLREGRYPYNELAPDRRAMTMEVFREYMTGSAPAQVGLSNPFGYIPH